MCVEGVQDIGTIHDVMQGQDIHIVYAGALGTELSVMLDSACMLMNIAMRGL